MDPKQSILRGPISKLTPFRIYKRFEEAVKSNATKDALIFEDDGVVRKHTYEELNNLANHLATIIRNTIENHELQSSQEKPHTIGVHMSASDSLIISLLAIWKAGASYLPLDPNYPKHRIEYIIRDAKPAMIIYEKDDYNFKSSFTLNISNLISTYTPSTQLDEKPRKEPDNDLAIVLYTSGSTGNPKGVCMSHTTLSNRLEWQFKNFPFSETENVCVFKTVITFVDSIFEIWAPLLKGRSVLILPNTTVKNPEKLVDALEKYKIERIILVPTLLETITLYKKIVINNPNLLQNLRLWISSGEVLTEKHVKQFYETFSSDKTKLCNFYGSTEITDVTYYVFTNSNDFYRYNCFPLGGAVDNTIIYVLDSNLKKCKENEVGEIYISGLNLPLKYISSQNEAKLIDNPFEMDPMFSKLYRIGDYGFMLDGFLFYKGRADTVVKLRGYRVDLLEVDQMVNLTEGVKKGVVLFHKDEILAFIEMHDLVTKEAIEDLLKSKLVEYMVPKIVIVSGIPLLVNGKTDRQLLLKNYEQGRPSVKDFDYSNIPEHQLEAAKILFEIISEFSSGQINSKISNTSNFYDIGGNSLNSISTISKLLDQGYRISIEDFVKASNLGEILNSICCSNNKESMTIEESTEYVREEIQENHKMDVINMVISSYYPRSSMDKLVQDIVKPVDYEIYLTAIWPSIISQKLSFVVKAKTGQIVGISLNSDGKQLFECKSDNKLSLIESFYTFLENPVFNKLYLKYERIMDAYLSATSLMLTPQENVKVMQYIEQEIINVAKIHNYQGILTTNTSRITEQLGDMYEYETQAKCPVKDYVTSDGSKPFGKAPDDFIVGCSFKEL